MNAMNFSQRHQKKMVIPKTHDLCQRISVTICRLNPAYLAHCGHWSFRFDYETDKLHHPAARLRYARLVDAPERGCEPAGPAWSGGNHAKSPSPFSATRPNRKVGRAGAAAQAERLAHSKTRCMSGWFME
jgi:hypothetical protein